MRTPVSERYISAVARTASRGIETAFRLSPRDPHVPWWQYFMCHLHTHLAHWEQAIEWCNKSTAGMPEVFYPYLDLAAANAWAGHDKEAKEAAAQLQKLYPGFTVQTLLGCTGPTIRPSTRNISASPRACARRACRRARRSRIERAARPAARVKTKPIPSSRSAWGSGTAAPPDPRICQHGAGPQV